MQTLLQAMLGAGKKWTGLGRRQRKKMDKCAASVPTSPLTVTYTNGMKVTYRPVRVTGQLLVCEATTTTPAVPQEVPSASLITISMYEFPDRTNRDLFRQYHEALMACQCLLWEDGTLVTSKDLLIERLEN